eukprot:scaffold13281_cov119-Isochrysis_galbana.AAC.7
MTKLSSASEPVSDMLTEFCRSSDMLSGCRFGFLSGIARHLSAKSPPTPSKRRGDAGCKGGCPLCPFRGERFSAVTSKF